MTDPNDEYRRVVEPLIEAENLANIAGFIMRKEEIKMPTDPEKKAEEIRRILGELAGAASLCWVEKPLDIFDASLSANFVDSAFEELNKVLVEFGREIYEDAIKAAQCSCCSPQDEGRCSLESEEAIRARMDERLGK